MQHHHEDLFQACSKIDVVQKRLCNGVTYYIVVSGKHGLPIGVITLSASLSSAASHIWFPINYFDAMHQFYSKINKVF